MKKGKSSGDSGRSRRPSSADWAGDGKELEKVLIVSQSARPHSIRPSICRSLCLPYDRPSVCLSVLPIPDPSGGSLVRTSSQKSHVIRRPLGFIDFSILRLTIHQNEVTIDFLRAILRSRSFQYLSVRPRFAASSACTFSFAPVCCPRSSQPELPLLVYFSLNRPSERHRSLRSCQCRPDDRRDSAPHDSYGGT